MKQHMWPGWQIWNLVEFLKEINALGSRAIFRGQSKSTWGLTPGLYRRPAIGSGPPAEQRYLNAENQMLEKFFDRAAHRLPNFKRSPLMDRVLAQHYGVPTQLLDWTVDPLIATYFASADNETGADGALFFMIPFNTVSNRFEAKLPYTGKLVQFFPPILDDRIESQKSVFTLQSYGENEAFTPLDERPIKVSEGGAGNSNIHDATRFGKVVIPSKHKRQLRRGLRDIGIDSSLLFPGLEGIGQRIADSYQDSSLRGF